MKCQRSAGSGHAAALACELLGAVLAEQREAGLGERAEVLDVDVLDGGEQLDVGGVAAGALRGGGDLLAHAVGVRAHADGVEAGSRAPHDPRLAARDAAVAAVGEEQLVAGAHRAQPDVVDRVDAAPAPGCARATAARSRLRSPPRAPGRRRTPRGPPRRPRSSSRARPGRARRCTARPRPARAARRRPRRRSRPASPRQPPCSAATAPSPTSITGRQSAANTSAARVVERGGLAVLLGRGPRRPGRLGGAPHRGAVDLAAVEEALARQADRGGEPLAVLVDVGAVVARSAGRG